MTPHLTDLDFLSLIDGSATAQHARAMSEHVAECEECAATVAAMESAHHALRNEVVQATTYPDLAHRVLTRVALRNAVVPAAPTWRPRWRDVVAFAAGVILATGLGRQLERRKSSAATVGPAPSSAAAATAQPGRARYLLLLRGAEPQIAAISADSLNRRYRAYGDWSRALVKEGRLIQAAKLAGDGGRYVARSAGNANGDTPPPNEVTASGFFVIWASDYADAVAWARKSPHLTFGGQVVVRRIE